MDWFKLAYRISLVLLLVSYLPMFFGYALDHYFDIYIEPIEGFYNKIYATTSTYGIALLLLTKKKIYLVPLIALFFVIGSIFLLNSFMDGFQETFFPVLIIIISTLLCSFIFFLLRHRYNSGQ